MTELYKDSGLELYEKSHYSHGEHVGEVEQILTWYKRRSTKILDIGCSGGLHALEFSKRGFSVTGVDIEPSAIELAKKRAIGNKNTKFFVADIEKDKLPCLEKFDMIYSIGNVFSHVSKDHIFEVLLQIIWKRKIDGKTGRISMDGIFLESGCIQHFDVWGYTVAEITGMLNSLGFVNIEFSEKLDFIEKNKTKNPISLYFRATRI